MVCIWICPLAVLIVLKNALNFVYELKQSKKKGTLTSENGLLIVLKLWKKINSFEEQQSGENIFHLDKFHKVLADILWNFETDELFFDLKNVVSESQISTKHEFLKVLSSVYDPLGIVYPTIITHKNVVSKDLYDERKLGRCTLPETIIAEWQNIVQNVNVMNSLKLEKHYSLRARDGFIQPIFYKGLTASVRKSDKMD